MGDRGELAQSGAAGDRARGVLRVRGSDAQLEPDHVVVEEPLQILLSGGPFAVVMRTPGDDADLAWGFLHAERIVRTPDDVLSIGGGPEEAPDDERLNTIDVELAPEARTRVPDRRLVVARSSCGVCGRRTIEEVRRDAAPVRSDLTVDGATLLALPPRLAAAQQLFARTGGLHAAALFDAAGELLSLREDVGRHNAVDKIVGAALREGRLPLSDRILLVSGRAGFEIVEKAVLAGIPVVASVSAPSSLALDLAEAADVAVVGFLRNDGFNVYTGRRRILAS